MSRHGKFLIALSAVLVGAILLQLGSRMFTLPEGARPRLASAVPSQLNGWTGSELPLAETEEAKSNVGATLHFDDYVSRRYTRGSAVVSVYVAYWAPNKVPPRLVGVHTPDTCWIMNGWRCEERRHGIVLPLASGERLAPGEFGTYTFDGIKQYVYFWHMVGGHPYAYMQEGAPSFRSIWAQLSDLRFGPKQRREQFFVRVASNQPWPTVWQTPAMQELFRSLSRLTLTPPASQH